MKVPTRVGKYEIIELLGKNLAVVYKARDSSSEQIVILKIFDDGVVRDGLLQEARTLATVQHPSILAASNVGELEGKPFIAYEFCEGELLDALSRTGTQLQILQKFDIILQLLDALQHVHSRGLVHRDVKPHNIMLQGNGRIKLLGFVTAAHASDMGVKTDVIAGTLTFMPPEILKGEAADHRADIFSAGVTLYQLLDGELPFQGETLTDTATKILNEQPRRSKTAQNSDLPELQAIFDKALAKQPDARYQSCTEFYKDIFRLKRRLETRG